MKTYTSQPIGRPHIFTRDDFARIAIAMGSKVRDDETLNDIAHRINFNVLRSDHRLKNLRILRRESGYADAKSVTHRGMIVGRSTSVLGGYFAGN